VLCSSYHVPLHAGHDVCIIISLLGEKVIHEENWLCFDGFALFMIFAPPSMDIVFCSFLTNWMVEMIDTNVFVFELLL
jgi:hypothetical protein